MIEPTNYGEVQQGVDRITGILQKQANPNPYNELLQSRPVGLPANILNMIAYSTPEGGNFAGNVMNYMKAEQDLTTGAQDSLLKAYQAKLQMGDHLTKALDDKISMFVGEDPYGKETILRELHALPQDVDPTNPETYSLIAGIAKKNGLINLDRQLEIEKQKTDIDYKRSSIGAMNALASKRLTGGGGGKPLPASALKLQKEILDSIGTAANIESDLGAVVNTLESGNLDLGPVDNLISSGRNRLGISSKNSRNYGTFRSTLEKLRNDSLRLNKGVQTEGDSVRAWNEILENITDQEFVKQRLVEVQEINRRGRALQEMNLNVIRQNYGHDPIDTSAYDLGPAILGGGRSTKEEDPRIQEALDNGYTLDEIQQYLGGQ